ncbi:GntR family transcriptional regulator [Microbacterium lacusdiani]
MPTTTEPQTAGVEGAARPAAAELTDRIREALLSGDFAPHQRLIEADLSDRFEASRASVRTALMNLAGEGLVERLPNRGARVRAITVDEAIEIVEVRIGLEVLCARKAAENLTEEDASGLVDLRERIQAAVEAGDLVGYASLNQEMDRRIREISGHATATRLLERLLAQSARHQFRLAYHPGRINQSAPEHIAIIDAVLARDADAAAEATRRHLEGIIALLSDMR